MNFLPVRWRPASCGWTASGWAGRRACPPARCAWASGQYLRLQPAGEPGALPATVRQVQDIGTYLLVTLEAAGTRSRPACPPKPRRRPSAPRWGAAAGRTCYYRNEELIA
jgi:glycerol transport system ATP-binding protein